MSSAVLAGLPDVRQLPRQRPTPLTFPEQRTLFNVSQLRPPPEQGRLVGGARDALFNVVRDALANDNGLTQRRGASFAADIARAFVDGTLDATAAKAVGNRHRSLATGRVFPSRLNEALDACMRSDYHLRMWVAPRRAGDFSLLPAPGQSPHLCCSVGSGPMFNTDQLVAGTDVARAPVRFGAFRWIPGSDGAELRALVERCDWTTGLFITEAQARSFGLAVKDGESPFTISGGMGGAMSSFVGGGAPHEKTRDEVLVSAVYVPGAELLYETLHQKAPPPSSPEAETARHVAPDTPVSDDEAAAAAEEVNSSLSALKASAGFHRRLVGGTPLTGPALAAALVLNSSIPSEKRCGLWLSLEEVAEYGLEVLDGAPTARIVGTNSVPSATIEDRVAQALEALDRARTATSAGGTLGSFLRQPLFNADQLVNPDAAFALSRDVRALRDSMLDDEAGVEVTSGRSLSDDEDLWLR